MEKYDKCYFEVASFQSNPASNYVHLGAIPACALKIIKFMLGFTATRWYKYVHVSAWTDFESLRLALFEDRASDLLSGVGRFLRNRREAPSRAGHAKLI